MPLPQVVAMQLMAWLGGQLFSAVMAHWSHAGVVPLWWCYGMQVLLVQFFIYLKQRGVTEGKLYVQQALLSLVLIFCLLHPLAPWVYLTGLIVIWLVQGRPDKDRVPLYFSSTETRKVLSDWLELHPGCFIDLGCGNGRLLAHLAERFPDRKFYGVEQALGPWLLARFYCRHLTNCQIIRSDLWDADLQQMAVVYVFLSPQPMPRLWQKFRHEASPGAWLLSNSFAIDGEIPQEIVPLTGPLQQCLLCYAWSGC